MNRIGIKSENEKKGGLSVSQEHGPVPRPRPTVELAGDTRESCLFFEDDSLCTALTYNHGGEGSESCRIGDVVAVGRDEQEIPISVIL